MCSAKTRASVVVAPPAGNGTIMVTGRDGYARALATRDAAGTAVAPAASCKNCLRVSFIAVTSTRASSLDHLVGASEQRQRNVKAECLCGLHVDDEFDLDCLLDWHLRRLLAFENTARINSLLAVRVCKA